MFDTISPGRRPARVVPIEPPAIEPVRGVVGRDDVGGGDELPGQLLAVGRVDVQRDGTLAGPAVLEDAVGVEGDLGGRLGPDVADGVEPVLRLQLDHVGAEVGEQAGGERPGDGPREVDDAHPGERLTVVAAGSTRVGRSCRRGADRQLGEHPVVGAQGGAGAPLRRGRRPIGTAIRPGGRRSPSGCSTSTKKSRAREVRVLGHVRHLVDRRDEQPARLALGDQRRRASSSPPTRRRPPSARGDVRRRARDRSTPVRSARSGRGPAAPTRRTVGSSAGGW